MVRATNGKGYHMFGLPMGLRPAICEPTTVRSTNGSGYRKPKMLLMDMATNDKLGLSMVGVTIG